MALDKNIYEIRREKLKKIEALGHPAYPRKYNFSHTVPQILAEYGGQTPRTSQPVVKLWRQGPAPKGAFIT